MSYQRVLQNNRCYWSFCSILCNLNVIFINNLRNNVESHYIFQLNIMNVIIKYEEVLKVVSKVQLRSFVSNCRGTNFRILGKKPLSSFIYFKRMTWKPPSPSHTHTHTPSPHNVIRNLENPSPGTLFYSNPPVYFWFYKCFGFLSKFLISVWLHSFLLLIAFQQYFIVAFWMALKNCFDHSSSQRTCFRSRSSLVVIAVDGGILPENVKI